MQRRQQSLLSFFHGGSEKTSSRQMELPYETSDGCRPNLKRFSENRNSFDALERKMLRPPSSPQNEVSANVSSKCTGDAFLERKMLRPPSSQQNEVSANVSSKCTGDEFWLSPEASHRIATEETHLSEDASSPAYRNVVKGTQKIARPTDERMRSFDLPHAVDSSILGIKRVREEQEGFLQDDSQLHKRKVLMDALGEGEEQNKLWEEAKLKFSWLSPLKLRDGKGRKMGDQFFDKRSLQIPTDVLNKMTASQKQYWTVKSQYMDTILFFKVGKFYELYELDAEVGHKELNWKMTVSGVGRCRQVGVPESGIEEAVEKLIARGYKVGRMEQVETAEQAKAKRGPGAMVQRRLTHVLTPSTMMDDNMKPEAVHLLALREDTHFSPGSGAEEKRVFGFAFVDAAVGQFYVGSLCDDVVCSALGALLTQVVPRELLYEISGLSDESMKALRRYSSQGVASIELTPLQPHVEFMDASLAMKMIDSHGYFSNLKVKGNHQSTTNNWSEILSSVKDCDAAVIALGALVQHLVRLKLDTSLLESSRLACYEVYKGSLRLDGQTLSNLEIFNNNVDGSETGTLFSFLNNCSTSFGKRLLRRWICHPLRRVGEINERLDALEDLKNHPDLVGSLRIGLRKLPDLERLVSQTHRFSALSFEATIPLLSNREKKRKAQALGITVRGLLNGIALMKSMNRQIGENAMSSRLLRALTSIDGLTEGHGLLEFICPRVEEKFLLSKRQSSKQDFNLDDKDTELLNDFLLEFNQHHECWRLVSYNLAQLDVLLSFTVSIGGATGPTCRPVFTSTDITKGGVVLKIEELWHPFALGGQSSGIFVRNNIELGSDHTRGRAMLLTGPNMGGKSTLLRATCLAVILAQIGCHVPAESCLLSPVDTIFTRLGATDRIMSGESTFMVECSEAASVLKYATPDSLVIMDELGRGTSTFDGYAIAYAVFRHLVDTVDCRLLFATHYHPLTKEFAAHPRVCLQHMACGFDETTRNCTSRGAVPGKCSDDAKERSLVFLYRLSPGASPDSYGLQVASLAGLPTTVIERAEQARSILQCRLSSTFQKNAHRVHFSHMHEQWLRMIIDASTQDESSLTFDDIEDSHDLLLCVWHELQSSLSKE